MWRSSSIAVIPERRSGLQAMNIERTAFSADFIMFLEPLLQKFHDSAYGDKKEDEDIRQPDWNRHENLQDSYNHGEKLIHPELYRKTPDTDCTGRTLDRAGNIAEHFHRPRPPPPPAPNHRQKNRGEAPLYSVIGCGLCLFFRGLILSPDARLLQLISITAIIRTLSSF